MVAADVPPPQTRHQHLQMIIPLFRNNPVSTRSTDTVPAPGSKLTNDCLWLERSLSTHNTCGLRHHNVCGQCKYLVSTNCTGKLYNEAVMKHSLDLVLLHDFSLSHRLNTISHISTILHIAMIPINVIVCGVHLNPHNQMGARETKIQNFLFPIPDT